MAHNIYSLQPINFEMLDAKQKRDAVSNFVGFVSSLPSSVQMTITREPVGCAAVFKRDPDLLPRQILPRQ